MSTLNISECGARPMSGVGPLYPVLPAKLVQNLTFTTTATTMATYFLPTTEVVIVTSDAPAWIVVGENPTATQATGTKIQANQPFPFYVNAPNVKLSVIG